MNNVIWKYSVEPSPKGPSIYAVPRNADILTGVQCQNGIPQVYLLVDPTEKEFEEIRLWCIGTGWNEISEDFDPGFMIGYVGSTMSKSGLVWHVFAE